MKRSLSVLRRFKSEGEIKHYLSICLSCVDSNMRDEMKSSLYMYVCLPCLDSKMRDERKRSLSICVA